jgi:capsular polysaccharide biosynthesis protein
MALLDPPARASVTRSVATAAAHSSDILELASRVSRGYQLSASGVLELPGGRFHLPSGIVASAGRFPDELITLDGFPYAWQLADTLRALWWSARTVPDGVLVSQQLSSNYYHWICEILPAAIRSADVDDAAGLPMYIAEDLPAFVADSLDLVGLGGRIRTLPSGVYRCETLRAPAFPGGAEWPSPSHLELVRRRMLERVAPAPGRALCLLVSRADAEDRRLRNEEELLTALAPFGVEPVLLGGMSVRDQVALFSRAELIVAPHGAGLTNALFAPRGCAVVELIGALHVSACYMIVASTVGHRHGYVVCPDRGRDLVADVGGVLSVLRDLGA